MGRRRCCCDVGCGCEAQAACWPINDRLIGVSTSNCPDFDGLIRYFTKRGGIGVWEADVDSGCLRLNDGTHAPSVIRCDALHNHCTAVPNEPCYDYYLEFHAYQCADTDEYCTTNCTCEPLMLEFGPIPMPGGPQGPFSGGVYTYLCGCDCEFDHADPDAIWISWVFTRLATCCCENLEGDPAPTLRATLEESTPCEGTMNGATQTMSVDGVHDCREWLTDAAITFTCADTDEFSLTAALKCMRPIGETQACCDKFELTVTGHAASPETLAAIEATCTCEPLYLRFGPFHLLHNGVTEEFFVVVTEE